MWEMREWNWSFPEHWISWKHWGRFYIVVWVYEFIAVIDSHCNLWHCNTFQICRMYYYVTFLNQQCFSVLHLCTCLSLSGWGNVVYQLLLVKYWEKFWAPPCLRSWSYKTTTSETQGSSCCVLLWESQPASFNLLGKGEKKSLSKSLLLSFTCGSVFQSDCSADSFAYHNSLSPSRIITSKIEKFI